ncbi:MAG: NACHT domain-containing protein [Burkholderiaceae bacterium]
MYIDKLLARLQAIPLSTWQSLTLTLLAVLGSVIVLCLLAREFRRLFLKSQASKLSKTLAAATKTACFTDEDIACATRHYIEPDCLHTDTRGGSDSLLLAAIRRKAFETIDEFLEKDDGRRLLVLADAAMGKTSLCLNFYAREQRKKATARRPIAIVTLGKSDALEQIKAMDRKAETMLFLDALDEDSAAIKDCGARLKTLTDATADFKAVILTCRDQFFLEDVAIPREFRTLYLLPFSASQIEHYLRLQFAWFSKSQRKKARELIRAIPEIGSRPPLLALLPDLLKKGRQITELFNVYALMVSAWLEREGKWITPQTLAELSKNLAVDIHTRRALRQPEQINLNGLRQIARDHQGTIDGAHLSARSLLKRDSDGNFNFAHPSVMEFFFINALIDGDDRCKNVEWTQGMRAFFMSWGRSKDGSARLARARTILAEDLRQTRLLPLFPAAELPQMYSSIEALKTGIQERAQLRSTVPQPWRNECLRFSCNAEVMHVYDFAEDLKWKIVLTHTMESYDERNLYRHPLSSLWTSSQDGKSKTSRKTGRERLPSVAELVSLWEAETALKDQKIFDRREFYWVGDKVGGYTYLACSIGKKPLTNELPISSSGVSLSTTIALSANGKQENLYLYEVMLRAASAGSSQFSAHTHMVETGVAESSWYSMSHADESVCSI